MSAGRRARPRAATALAVLGWSVGAAGGAALIAAGLELRRLGPPTLVERELDRAALSSRRGGVYGVVERDLPPYRLHWDGRPPRAEIVDRRTGAVVAPAVLERATLELNRDAVLWTRADAERLVAERCEFVLSRSAPAALGNLVLRFEVPAPARWLHRLALAAALLAFGGALSLAARLAASRPNARPRLALRGARTALFLGLAVACFVVHFPGPPWLAAETDAASINSFAAALDRPEDFRSDALLDRRSDFDWYIPAYVALVRGAARLGLPYSAAYAFLGLLGTWLSLVGYDRLFTRLSGSQLYGFVASLAVVLLTASYPPNEHWAFSTVLPRSLFTALLPWVLLPALRWAPQPGRWWLAAAGAAALFYVHPASSPALSAALLVGWLVGGAWLPGRWHAVAAAVAVSALIMFPYAWRYGQARQGAEVGATGGARELLGVVADFAPAEFYCDTARLILRTPRYWALVGALAWLAVARPPGRRLFWGMLAGWALVTFAIPAADWWLAERLARQPFQINLVRNLRYLDLWLLAALALLVRAYRRRAPDLFGLELRLSTRGRAWAAGRSRLGGAVLAGCLGIGLCYAGPAARSLKDMTVQAISARATLLGRLRAVPAARLEAVWALQALRPAEEPALVPPDLDFVRQLFIPLAYTWKDPETLSYAAAAEMAYARRVVNTVERLLEPPVDESDARSLAAVTGARLVLVERWRSSLELRESEVRVFLNDRYVMVRLPAPVAPSG